MQANQFDFYPELGIDLSKLGYLMLDTETPLDGDLPNDGEYISADPNKPYVKGLLTDWHITARGGLLENVRQTQVKEVLTLSVVPASLSIADVEVFPSPYLDEPYDCVVALIDAAPGSEIFQLNSDLGVLPNIATYTEYRPHVTIGYFEQGWYAANSNEVLLKDTVPVLGINFGKMQE